MSKPEPTEGSLELAERFAIAALLSLVDELLVSAEPIGKSGESCRVQTRRLELVRRAVAQVRTAQHARMFPRTTATLNELSAGAEGR